MRVFQGRTLHVATMHGKERVLGPMLERDLGVRVSLPPGLDTDCLGTFSGERERIGDVLSVLRAKCRMAMEATGGDLALASEGCFGPHPTLCFVPADEEWVMLMDCSQDLEVVGRVLSTETNYAFQEVSDWQALERFATEVRFPSHGLILRDRCDGSKSMVKGLIDWNDLRLSFDKLMRISGGVDALTDMRAMFNPTRMQVIGEACRNLIDRLKSACPACARLGYGVTESRPGLPCRQCLFPTRSVLYSVFSCAGCGHREDRVHPHGKTHEDPMYCDVCNP